MIFFAQTAANQSDLVVKEALRAGAENVRATASGVQFSASLETGYRFTMTTRIASRVLLALYFDDNIDSPEKLYESCMQVPWHEYLTPEMTFQVTQTVQACNWLKNSHEPYVVIASGDGVYKLDFNKVLEYHISKRADVTVVCTEGNQVDDISRFGVLKMNEDCRIEEFEEKPMMARSNVISTGIYVIRRRQLIEMIERCAQEGRYDFVNDVLIRYKNLKRIYGYKIDTYWSNIASVEDYYRTNMDFLKPEVREYFFGEYPGVYSKIDDLPPAKYNPGSCVKNSLVASGCIINGQVENSILFKGAYVGNNCVIKNSIILNDVYLGDNTHIENCIVESRDTIRANSYHCGEDGIKIVVEKNERYAI